MWLWTSWRLLNFSWTLVWPGSFLNRNSMLPSLSFRRHSNLQLPKRFITFPLEEMVVSVGCIQFQDCVGLIMGSWKWGLIGPEALGELLAWRRFRVEIGRACCWDLNLFLITHQKKFEDDLHRLPVPTAAMSRNSVVCGRSSGWHRQNNISQS